MVPHKTPNMLFHSPKENMQSHFIHLEVMFILLSHTSPLISSKLYIEISSSVQFNSVSQLCPTLCNPMDYSTPGYSVHHQLLKLAQTHVHQVDDAIQPSSVVPFSSCLQSFPASGSFPVSQFFASDGQSIRVSASASVLPMNIQNWFPLGWTGWISLHSRGLSRVFSNTTVQTHQFFGA